MKEEVFSHVHDFRMQVVLLLVLLGLGSRPDHRGRLVAGPVAIIHLDFEGLDFVHPKGVLFRRDLTEPLIVNAQTAVDLLLRLLIQPIVVQAPSWMSSLQVLCAPPFQLRELMP